MWLTCLTSFSGIEEVLRGRITAQNQIPSPFFCAENKSPNIFPHMSSSQMMNVGERSSEW
jgi:hypothetical protein